MKLLKRASKSEWGQSLLARLAVLYLRFVDWSLRWTVEAPPATAALMAGREPVIVAFWHGRMLIARGGWRNEPERLHVVISDHSDGRLIARAIGYLGFSRIRKPRRGGETSALREMRRVLERGDCVGITPDGPRGPRMHAKAGAIKAAQLTGVPIVPGSGSSSRRRLFGSWDRFCLLLPFGRGLLLWGEPIYVPRDADKASVEIARRALEDSLNALSAKADRALGFEPVVPAAPGEALKAKRA
jgi:lysophospholipid acyltransferase (LPLAT)-like uncharacterized protein